MIDDFSKYKFFYINGCSHIEGGGLEEPQRSNISPLSYYKKNYNVYWKSRKDVNVGTRLSQIIGIDCINEAKCGGGPERVVRMTYEFINKNWEDRDKFFIILEKPNSIRFEVFYNNEYYIGNTIYNYETKQTSFGFVTRDYWEKKIYKEDASHQTLFKSYYDNFFNHAENVKKNDFAFTGLYSFCKRNNIKIFLMMQNDYFFNDNYESDDIILFEKDKLSDIATFCRENKLTITDETDYVHKDFHPGYFGHIEYAKKLAQHIGWNGDFPDFPNYYDFKKNKQTLI